jgi:hypothetical protein
VSTAPVGADQGEKLSARRAWVWIALVPVGVVANLIVMYLVAGLMGVVVEPANGQHASLGERVVILGISGLVAMVFPAMAIVRAFPIARAGSRSGRIALVVACLLLLLTLIVTIGNIMNPGNML